MFFSPLLGLWVDVMKVIVADSIFETIAPTLGFNLEENETLENERRSFGIMETISNGFKKVLLKKKR